MSSKREPEVTTLERRSDRSSLLVYKRVDKGSGKTHFTAVGNVDKELKLVDGIESRWGEEWMKTKD